MGDKEDLEKIIKNCRSISAKKQSHKAFMKKLSRMERLKIRGRGVVRAVDKLSQQATKFDVEKSPYKSKKIQPKETSKYISPGERFKPTKEKSKKMDDILELF